MGQYHMPVNLTKQEFIDPHKLGAGLKMWEQFYNRLGTGSALAILLAHPVSRGGGDFNESTGDEAYDAIAQRTIGRWHGDRIAFIGDYAADGDIPGHEGDPESEIYGLCREGDDGSPPVYKDISEDVCAVIEAEADGMFVGSGWRRFVEVGAEVSRWVGKSPNHRKETGTVHQIDRKAGVGEIKWSDGSVQVFKRTDNVNFF